MKNLQLKLRGWRSKRAAKDGVELFVVLHNKTIDEIAEKLPRNKEEFKAIKGLGGKKFEKYGQEILSIVNDSVTNPVEPAMIESDSDEQIYTVSSFIGLINSKLADLEVNVRGEIASVDFRPNCLYITLKDLEADSSIRCFMWQRDYEASGIELQEGLEVIVHGRPEIFSRTGSFSIQTDAIELVGEGVLKKKYDELKKKLTAAGVFDESKKRPLPLYPCQIGVITSKHGAVINDLLSNMGRFGYKVSLYDSRVEGVLATRDLAEAIRYFRDKSIDVLVVIRGGGGSLEILQAFNNEALIREIVDYPVPVICGIGHDKDVPLFAMAADKAFSTPTAVARELNRTWENTVNRLGCLASGLVQRYQLILLGFENITERYYSKVDSFQQKVTRKIDRLESLSNNIIRNYSYIIDNTDDKIYRLQNNLRDNFNLISKVIENARQIIKGIITKYHHGLTLYSRKQNDLLHKFTRRFSDNLVWTANTIKNSAKLLNQNNPYRQLKLGYSVVFSNGKIVKSVHQIKNGVDIINKVSDGEIVSIVSDIKTKE